MADDWPVFRVDNPDLIAFLKLPARDPEQHQDGKHYSWNQIKPSLATFDAENERIQTNVVAANRNAYEHAVIKVHERLELYAQLKNTLQPPESTNWKAQLADYVRSIPAGRRRDSRATGRAEIRSDCLRPVYRLFAAIRFHGATGAAADDASPKSRRPMAAFRNRLA